MSNTAKRIYLDYNATTPLSPEVFRFYVKELELYANASSLHDEGRRAAKAVEQARRQVGALINAEPDSILFTSGGSESNNTVFNTMAETAEKRGRELIVTTAIEHPCVMESAKHLEDRGFPVIYLPVDRFGIVDGAAYRDAMTKKPLLVSVMAANNEIGTVQDIPLLAALAREAGALFHTDAVQAAGKISVDAAAWGVDYLTLSGHKIYGPKGVEIGRAHV
jgi:cysteine desulfurase